MKKVIYSISLMLFCLASVCAQELGKAPEEIRNDEESWTAMLEKVSPPRYLKTLLMDPNYQTSQLAYRLKNNKGLVVSILKNKNILAVTYDWIQPLIQERWKNLSYYEKAQLRILLLHCKDYLQNFSVEKEDAYLEECKNKKGGINLASSHIQFHRTLSGLSYFARWNPNEDYYDKKRTKPKPEYTTSPYRRLETFFYRRVKEGVPLKNLRYMVEQLLADLPFPKEGTFVSKQDTGEKRLLAKVNVKNSQLNGVCMSYKYNHVQDSGRYVNNKKEGEWISHSYKPYGDYSLSSISKEYYRKGKLIRRTWTSYYGGKKTYRIWFDLDKQRYSYTDIDYNTQEEELDYEGAFFEEENK